MLPGPVTRSTRSHVLGAVREHRHRLGPADRVAPRRRRAARRRPAPPGAAGRRARAAAGWPPRASRPRPPAPARRSSRRWTGTRPGRPARTARPGAPAASARSPGRRARPRPSASWRACASCTSRARRAASSTAARTCGSIAASACAERLGRNPRGGQPHPVEALGGVQDRGRPALADVVADRPHGVERGLDVERRAREHVAGVHLGPAQVDTADHAAQSRRPGMPAPPRARTVEGWPSAR